ncbi:hypothetical protein N5A93_00095 [Roseovarius sp. EGI FJ00037]|uniref:hypothetical protein n=1 Tax=Roseovarius salincola TaxID=2978479 RepID=UPI0022A7AB96|nr:hypothetical protein [Roseovarius sp. EGI FJ00037]MCZ0810620.1 hypothetical protein [Roseovarius sp. EGI FJ00037]
MAEETTNGANSSTPQVDPEMLKKLGMLRVQVSENFGKVTMALPRYRDQSLGDLSHPVLEPLIRDRIAIAYTGAATPDAAADV